MAHIDDGERLASKAPPLNQAERDAINALFPAYIFRRSRTDEIWTTCCRKHMVVTDEDMMVTTPERNFPAVMWEPHQREQRNRWDDAPRPTVQCPLCGRMVIVKELRYTGKRDNLSRYRRAVVLRWYRGALWARAYDCAKHYSRDKGYSLTGEPNCKLVGVYRFKPGLAEATTRCWWDYPFSSVERQDGPLVKGHWNIHGPFNANAEYGVGYDVIGLDEIQESPFRYCMAEEAGRKFTKFLEYLTACCFYPRQIEMLMKAGMNDVVHDLVDRGVKHAIAINWDEPKMPFKLDRQDMKTFLSTSRDIQIIELHNRLKGHVSLTECAEWVSRGVNIQKTFQAARKWNLPPEKLIRYLDGYVGCAQYGGMSSLDSALRFWEDYLTAAEAMGYQLHRENVLLPRNLGTAHDEATKKHQAKLARERAAQQREWERQRKAAQAEHDCQVRLAEEKYEERRQKLEKKYGFAMDSYVIRAPMNKDEVLTEGRKLQHCVGGYADRHIQGKTTILFMRKAKKPDEPWLTIEMNGNKLVQIHGFKNEGIHTTKGRIAPDPREVYREFLDAWLDWLEKGSRRDEHGNPKLPKKKGAAA